MTNRRPRIVCLCGSTRFYKHFQEANYLETIQGRIVLSVGFYPHAVNEMHGEGIGITEEQKEKLDELHKRKIDLCDEILVLNVGGHIGSSTRSEIEYAREHNKEIRYLESTPMTEIFPELNVTMRLDPHLINSRNVELKAEIIE